MFSFRTLRVIPLLAKLLIPQEFRIHPPRRHVLSALLLLDTIGMRLLGVVVGARILRLFVRKVGRATEIYRGRG